MITKINKLHRVTILLLLLVSYSQSFAYNRFEHLTVEDGLAHTDATSMIQDKSGLMWIGTNSGLQSYDGYTLKLYDYYKNSTSKIRKFHNRITTLGHEVDRLWVGTKSGLLSFCLKEHNFKSFKISSSNSILTSDIKNIFVDKKGNIFIKTSAKIFHTTFNNQEQTLYVHDSIASTFPQKQGFDIFAVHSFNNKLWLVTERHLIKLSIQKKKFKIEKSISSSSFLPQNQIINNSTIYNNKLYFRTEQGCMRIDINSKTGEPEFQSRKYLDFYSTMPGIPVKSSGKIIVDRNETLWVSNQNGLFEFRSPFKTPTGYFHKKVFSDPKSLSTNFLSTLYVDRNNNLWVGTWGGGVNFMSSNEPFFKLIKYTPESKFTLIDQFVKAVEKDKDGTLWILTQKGGLNHYDINKGLIKAYDFSDTPIANKVYKDLTIMPDNENLLIGTIEGLIVFNKRTGRSKFVIGQYDGAILKKITHIYSLDIDNYGNIWAGTWDAGLICLKPTNGSFTIQHFFSNASSKIKLSSNLVSHVLCDKQKNEVLICTDNGLNRILLDNKGLAYKNIIYKSDESNPNSLSSDFISVIDKQNDSIYWLGTLGGGLNKFTITNKSGNYKAESLLKKDGLQSDNVEIVLVDGDGNVWFSVNGISKLDTKTGSLSYYDYRDGLQGNSFKIGAGYKDNEGVLYFGGIYGLNYFNPQEIKSSENKSELIFTDLFIHSNLIEPNDESNNHIILEKTLNETEVLELRYDENDFAISFSALNYWTSSRIKYRYRMVGLNKEWLTIGGTQNKVFYSNLDYNDYTFQIQVSSDGGKTWNENTKSLEITVMPPWWLSIYAKLIYFAILVFIIVTLFRFYNREMEMKHELEIKDIEEKNMEDNHQLKLQFFMNISHEFKTPLTLILSSIERLSTLAETDEMRKDFFDTISRNANKMLTLITELMDFRKTDIKKDVMHLSREDIKNYIYQICNEFNTWASKKNMTITQNLQSVEMNFDREKVAKIVTNLLSNAIKYSNEGSKVEIELSKGYLKDIVCKYDTKHTEGNMEQQTECCFITVRDAGIGITKESIGQIYDRFFQIESKTSMHLGSGIGLAVAKNMALSHKGAIIVSSERNVGTEFIVAIPLSLQIEMNAPELPKDSFDTLQYIEDQHLEYNYDLNKQTNIQTITSNKDTEKPTLLLVEDNIELLVNLQQYFADDYKVLTAENGKIGLEMCKENYPDLIVSDVMMPEMDGIQLCAAVRENLNIAYTPIILLTAKSDVEHQLEGYEAGADLYIPKPFSLKLLELNIKRLITLKNDLIQTKTTEISENSESNLNLRENIIDQKEKEFLAKLIQLINENLEDTEYSVDKLCRELGVGRTKLYTKVKDITGQALGDLIRDIRLNRAAYLLRHTDFNVTEVIYDVGFGSNSHFSKAFKAKFGITPSDYAKQGKSNSPNVES